MTPDALVSEQTERFDRLVQSVTADLCGLLGREVKPTDSIQMLVHDVRDAIERLTRERDEARDDFKYLRQSKDDMEAERDAARAELANARNTALEEAANVADGFRCGGCGMDGKAGAAIRALQASGAAVQVPEDQVLISVEMLDFLRGIGRLNGVHFDDTHPTERGAFWWRKHLPAAPQKQGA